MTKLLTLEKLGPRLRLIDTLILMLVKRRMDLCSEVEAIKHEKNDEPIVRSEIESDRIEFARTWAVEHGLNPHLAASLEHAIINESCHLQMEQRQSNTRPVFEPKDDDEWRRVLKENLLTLTERWSVSYDQNYRKRVATNSYLEFERERISVEIDLLADKELLVDLGCATGCTSLHLADRFKRVVGYDISQHMVNVANQKIEGTILENKASFVAHDLETGIPLADDEASMVIMNLGTASDIPDIEGVIKEIHRVLKPGGRFLLSFYNRDALLYQTAFIPWPVGLGASISLHKDCLDVYSEKEVLSIYARPHTVDEVEGMLIGMTDGHITTYPTVSCIMPNEMLEGDFSIAPALERIDRELATTNHGAYIIATGQKRI